VTATRVMRGKGLEGIIGQVSALARSGIPVRYVIVGLLEDDYAAELLKFISSQPDPTRFACLPFQDHEGIRRVYCAADIGIWIKAAISIQAAMGTGLPVILEDKPVVRHLVRDGDNGWFFPVGGLEARMRAAVAQLAALSPTERATARRARAEANRLQLSYDILAAQIIDGLATRSAPNVPYQA